MLKKLARYKRERKGRAWERLKQTATAIRKRMIAANRSHPVDGLPTPVYPRNLKRWMPKDYKETYEECRRNSLGRKVLNRHKEFWRVPFPPRIDKFPKMFPGKKVFVTGMGWTPKVYLAQSRNADAKRTVVKGHWFVACRPDGRQYMIFNGKSAPKGPWRFVGYAPQTDYIPSKELEQAGSPKAGFHWQHLHDDEGGVWPKVYADHGGKLSSSSNFIYDVGTYTTTDWIRR
jgi:hypothetical protein